ncbi:Type 1 glutamine amidotransferase-like domain-containing protein [Bacillus sp. CGMCC 1.16607]|uniref:Type 1 glutamine amidotransferase-like domain-containing protein n=1 Tax=Bacillus sp. CGMCC 1.16607 TaxID=3351842 RepID=UPI0036324D6C
MGKVIAIGGGYNGGDFDIELEKKIRHFVLKDKPKVVFIPYASDEFYDNYHDFKDIYESLSCEVDLLQQGNEKIMLHADLIYIGRGQTIPLMEKLNETYTRSILLQALETGAIVAGFSAGAHSLFTIAGSNEEEIGYTLVEGLGLINECMISHYNYEDRAEAFHQLLLKRNLAGIGLEDHTMLVYNNGQATVYSSKVDSHAYLIKPGASSHYIQPFENNVEFPLSLGK